MKITITSMLLTLMLFGFGVAVTNAQKKSSNVVINETQLSDEILSAFEKRYDVRIPDGNYWYDATAGAWGMEGGPTLGFTQAGLKLGGSLRTDASRGNTKVFINGRELHIYDVISLQQLIAPYSVMPGRYWVDSNGYFGYEGGWRLGNLVEIARAGKNSGGNGKGSNDSGIGAVIGDNQGCVGFVSSEITVSSSKC